MARSKIIINNEVYMDITDTTAVASDVAQGKYFYLANGTKVQGTSSGGGVDGDNLAYGFFNAIVGDSYIGTAIVGEQTLPNIGTALIGLTRIGE